MCLLASPSGGFAEAQMKPGNSTAILHELESLRQMGSVLYVAAHPDDENTELLAYLSRGRNYRTAYLSLTRGDGGQNVLGPDLGAKLGVARTQELIAARKIDGARQFFSRAIDFGYSKSYDETLKVWDKKEVLSDIVHVIREFRPDVIITRFSPSPGGTHGHHTASAVLAMEAFKLSGDPKAFPEQGLAPWQARRILWNVSMFQKDKAVGIEAFKENIGGRDAVSGELFTDIAGKSRAMHKTQGFDNWKISGATGGDRMESFHVLDGEKASKDIMDGIDCSWHRVKGGDTIEKSIDSIIAHFNKEDAAASVPALLQLSHELNALNSNDPVVKEKQGQVEHILQDCLGLQVESTISERDVVPGETIKVHHEVRLASKYPVRWVAVRYPSLKKELKKGVMLHEHQSTTLDSTEVLPVATPLTQPWWLRKEGTAGTFGVDDTHLIGAPENPPAFPMEEIFEIDGHTLLVHDEPVFKGKDAAGKITEERMNVIPPVSLKFSSDILLLHPGESGSAEVEVKSARANSSGQLQLNLPAGWKSSPQSQSFQLSKVADSVKLKFQIIAPKNMDLAKITACAELKGARYCNQHEEVSYTHIPIQLLQPPAVLKAISLDMQTRGRSIGYLPGAGDSLPEHLKQMGYEVRMLDDADLKPEQLKGLDAVVLGVRALNVRNKIGDAMPLLLDYVENGGTLIVQYNRPDNLKASKFSPYDIHISADRITDEKAAPTFLAPDNPVLNSPNKISASDFDGWVQERGLYFPNQWDEHFTPILAFSDPGEAPLKGALLVAQYGKGHYIYTGLGFFRQLPSGVPGAYRLFANLLSIKK
jgi:LmbE family N-acetylglucosaminyl deacetylase